MVLGWLGLMKCIKTCQARSDGEQHLTTTYYYLLLLTTTTDYEYYYLLLLTTAYVSLIMLATAL